MSLLDRLKIVGKSDSYESENKVEIEIVESNTCRNISYDKAMTVTSFSNAIHLISDTISMLPIKLYVVNNDGEKEENKTDYRLGLLNKEPNSNETSQELLKNVIVDFLAFGNGFIDIERYRNKIVALRHIPYSDISIIESANLNKRDTLIKYRYWGMEQNYYNVLNLARNPTLGANGTGTLKELHDVLVQAIELEEYSKNTLSNGFNAKGVVQSEKILSKPTRESLQKRLRNFFSGSRNSGKVLILDDGMKFNALSLKPVEIDLIKQKEYIVEEVARGFNTPSYLLGANGAGSVYSNADTSQFMFYQQTLQPIIEKIEKLLNKYLLLESEKDTHSFNIDISQLLRTTTEKQIRILVEAVKGTLITPNEARCVLGYKKLEDLDRPLKVSGFEVIESNNKGDVKNEQKNEEIK